MKRILMIAAAIGLFTIPATSARADHNRRPPVCLPQGGGYGYRAPIRSYGYRAPVRSYGYRPVRVYSGYGGYASPFTRSQIYRGGYGGGYGGYSRGGISINGPRGGLYFSF